MEFALRSEPFIPFVLLWRSIMSTTHSRPSDSGDPRYVLPRSPHCPNDAPAHIVAQGVAGTCGHCAWGFYSLETQGHGEGEPANNLHLSSVVDEQGKWLGYKARCGKVNIVHDIAGRIGALRTVNGEQRFFPGSASNWAYQRYVARHPILARISKVAP